MPKLEIYGPAHTIKNTQKCICMQKTRSFVPGQTYLFRHGWDVPTDHPLYNWYAIFLDKRFCYFSPEHFLSHFEIVQTT